MVNFTTLRIQFAARTIGLYVFSFSSNNFYTFSSNQSNRICFNTNSRSSDIALKNTKLRIRINSKVLVYICFLRHVYSCRIGEKIRMNYRIRISTSSSGGFSTDDYINLISTMMSFRSISSLKVSWTV